MISMVDGAARAHTIRSLRAACELLAAAADDVRAVSVSGRLPEADAPAMPILTLAQALAAECGLIVRVEVDGERFVIQFRKGGPAARPRALEAG